MPATAVLPLAAHIGASSVRHGPELRQRDRLALGASSGSNTASTGTPMATQSASPAGRSLSR